MTKRTILITGGAGFLGSHLVDAYLALGYRVIAVDDFSSGLQASISHLASNPDFVFIQHDICDPLPESVTEEPISVIANLASPASPPHYQRLALETLAVGSVGMTNVLELAKTKKARFFQASTSEVYGDPDVHPQPETYHGSVNCYGPRSMYDESKRFAEAVMYVYRHKYGIDTTIGRFFNTYGPRMDPGDGRVVSNFIVQALQGKPLTLYGDGSQTRSFCYVDDLIACIIAMIESEEEGPINMGNPSEFTVKELAEKVIEQTGSRSELTYRPLPADDPLQRKPVINLARERLGWEPRVDLDEGLAKTIAYFKEVLALNPNVSAQTNVV